MGGGSYRLETIRKPKIKIFIFLIIIALIISIIYINRSKARYEVSHIYEDIVTGTVKNSSADLTLVSIYIDNNLVNEIIEGKYEIDQENSKCTVNNEEINDITFKIENNKIGIYGITTKNTKCNVYLNTKLCEGIACNTILANSKKGEGTPNFNNTSCKEGTNVDGGGNPIGPIDEDGNHTSNCEESTNGWYPTTDDYGTSYYFRGTVDDNWFKFGQNKEGQDLYWRIIRINGDNSIRLLYNGPTTEQYDETTIVEVTGYNYYQSAEEYNYSRRGNQLGGYMYNGKYNSTNTDEMFSNEIDSYIKTYLENWYTENLTEENDYIEGSTGFCNDRTTYICSNSESGYGECQEYTPVSGNLSQYLFNFSLVYRLIYFGASSRNYKYDNYHYNSIPSLNCNSNDLFTTSNPKNQGNQAQNKPIGLITTDELIYIGFDYYEYNNSAWAFTNQHYWTMSPSYSGTARTSDSGSHVTILSKNYIKGDLNVLDTTGIRPVINLKDLSITGKGTITEPYTLK